MVNKVHHDECENGDKAAAVCTIRVSTTLKHSASSSFKISTQKVYSQFEIDHLFKAIVLPNLVYGCQHMEPSRLNFQLGNAVLR